MEKITTAPLTIFAKETTIHCRSHLHSNNLLPAIFPVTSHIPSILRILSYLQKNLSFFPLSPKEIFFPAITSLPKHSIILSTSGTTGSPKKAILPFTKIVANIEHSHPDFTLLPQDQYLLSLPLHHISGLSILFRALFYGSTIVLPESPNKKNVTHISFVPTQLKRFLANKEYDIFPRLKAILLGGSPIPYSLCKEAYQLGLPIYVTYGMTEMSSQIATKKFHPDEEIYFGHPLPFREIWIQEDGEIFVRGKSLFRGYLHQPSPIHNEWFPTKDIGKIKEKGLYYLGRKDRMFISGGENIYPEEIEQACLSHPQIIYAKVSHREDIEYIHRPTAEIETSLSVQEVIEYLSTQLHPYKIPNKSDIKILTNASK